MTSSYRSNEWYLISQNRMWKSVLNWYSSLCSIFIIIILISGYDRWFWTVRYYASTKAKSSINVLVVKGFLFREQDFTTNYWRVQRCRRDARECFVVWWRLSTFRWSVKDSSCDDDSDEDDGSVVSMHERKVLVVEMESLSSSKVANGDKER